jgi:hypothetical protein
MRFQSSTSHYFSDGRETRTLFGAKLMPREGVLSMEWLYIFLHLLRSPSSLLPQNYLPVVYSHCLSMNINTDSVVK